MFYAIKYNSKIFIGIILSIGLNFTLFSQSDSSGYYARQKFVKDSIRICRPKNVYPQLALDNRKSFIRNSPVDIRGFYAGILFKSRFKFGIGYYQVASEGRINRKTKDKQVPTIRDLELYYTTFNFEFLAVNKRYIKLGLPLDLGYGYSNVSIYDENKIKLLYHSVGNFIPVSIGTELTIKPFRWFGITGLIGYRKILKNSESKIDFDGFFYSYGLAIDVKEIIKDLRLWNAKKRYKKAILLK